MQENARENAFFLPQALVNSETCSTFAIANGKQARCHNARHSEFTPSLNKMSSECEPGEVAELVDALL